MEIGSKIKNARIAANLTQDQAAQSLFVSRQTISNWETCKTYPDIISVIRMSDLYGVSLDSLLKEGDANSSYLEYLEESTNVIKNKTKYSKLVLMATYLLIWSIAIIVYGFFMTPSDAFGYSLLFLWFLLPITTFTLSILIGVYDYWGKKKWVSSLLFGFMYMLAEYLTFSASNMIHFHKFNLPEFEMWIIGTLVSLVGIGIGMFFRYWVAKKVGKEEQNVDQNMLQFFERKSVKSFDKMLELMLLLPCLVSVFVKAEAGMAVSLILFFIVYPIYSAYLGVISGKNKDSMWYMPLVNALLFLIGQWLFIIQGINYDIIFYAVAYLVIGYGAFGLIVLQEKRKEIK